MKTAIIVAAFGALSLMTVGCKDKAETTNPDEAAAPAEAAPAEEAPAEEASEEAAEESSEEAAEEGGEEAAAE
ncbi:MAG: hypothetical protein KC420_03035 [Myxococcales bacterium]|nr:hypothetical protein [Myxococcales bacterium]MCB9705939.1 hypothetical protein [Myxococcales bacterium]